MRFAGILTVVGALTFGAPALAQGFSLTMSMDDWTEADEDGACLGRFDGQITKDSEIPYGYGTSGAPLCLNSPGGTLSRALDIGTNLGWHTRVLPGERCESACALAFLRGGYETGNGVPVFVHDRAIWAGAKLGFHSPGLTLPDSAAVDKDTVESAFKIALSAAAGVYAVHQAADIEGTPTMNAYLYQRFLDTPPDQMHYIDKVGEAILAQIPVLGVERQAAIDEDLIETLCENAMIASRGFESSLWTGLEANRSATRLQKGYRDAMDEFYGEAGDNSVETLQIMLTRDDAGDLLGYMGLVPSGDYRFFAECFVPMPANRLTAGRFAPGDTVGVWLGTAYGWVESASEVRERWNDAKSDDPVRLDSLALFPWAADLADLPKNAEYRRLFGGRAPAPTPVAAPVVVAETGFRAYPGRDIVGRDLKTVSASSLSQCQAACEANPRCNAATLDRWNNRCFLKDLPRATTLRLFAKASSVVRSDAQDFVRFSNADLVLKKRNDKSYQTTPDRTVTARNFDDCAAICQRDGDCLGVNWRPGNQCQLYATPPEYFTERGVDIGYFEQP
ncbi:PAN domain-containing protein [Tropicibacter naphthalenivorans]|uniref:PAN domain protein n=1 Tax=Tropicibacter naphthalenivorans TaxID=441103 RepID=A0A0P1GTJ8_9RHOB|nr:PAN domain-containing protein [Tropicibacter naphthalenivorans]CUH78751.1 PAN domain protein [Tropicibacter naphthalenivorans]SMC81382.1 PAN domain-containing protein [Tropicibacter naphthalenivorans]